MGVLMSTDHRHVSWLLWLWWVAAGAIGGGLAGTVAAPLERAANSYVYLVVAATITAALHWLLLRRYIRGAVWWLPATIAGQVMAFQFSGNIYQFVAAFLQIDLYAATNTFVFPQSFLLGTVVGLVQWLVLRQRVARAGWWILACGVGWALFGPVARDVGAALAGIVTGVIGGTIGAVVVVLVLRQRLSHSSLWVLAAVAAWVIAWIAAIAGSSAEWQTGRGALNGALEGAALSALPGVALVLLLRRPIATRPHPFEWWFWRRWVLACAGSAALVGAVLGGARYAMFEYLDGGFIRGHGDFVLVLFAAIAITVVAIHWLLLRQRLPFAWLWGLGSTLCFLVLGFLWVTNVGDTAGLAALAGGVVAGVIQWIPLRQLVQRASRWILVSTIGVAIAGPLTILVGSIANNIMVIVGAAVAAPAVSAAIYTAGITSVTGMALIWLLQEPRPTLEEQERA